MIPTEPDPLPASSEPAPGPAPEPTASPATLVGPYRILRELGRGGMGVVYLAMRDDGTFRKNVALKLLLKDQVSPEFVLRFKQERQVVAALDHPNIARILDGGDAPDGMPYYVMEYVEGLPLDQYCDRQRVSLSARLKLFQQVCQAVDYLHQNSIVHRDLKPSNILVSADGIVKLLDFGIAKMMGAASLASQELTGVQGRPMTPIYASPEQIAGATLQKTSDIYSLGVVLYRLLTGQAPYQNLDDKIAKLSAHQDPPLPSANIRDELRAAPESTAQLRRAMMGELDSIVLMALRHDPKERYQSAKDFSDDLQRFLDGLSVKAHRDSMAGRSVKLLKRKRAVVAILAAFAVVSGFGIWQWRRAGIQKTEVAAREASLRSLLEQLESHLDSATTASQAQPAAPQRMRDVERLKSALDTDFAAVVARQPGRDPQRDALLDRAVRYLDRVHTAAPKDAALNAVVARSYEQLGVYQEKTADQNAANRTAAVKTYQKASGVLASVSPDYPDYAAERARLARLNQRIKDLGGAVEQVEAPPQTSAPEQTSTAPTAPAKPVTRPLTPLSKPAAATPPPETPPVSQPAASAPAPAPANGTPELAELQNRLAQAAARVQIADETIAPLEQSLQQRGQVLNSETAAAKLRMHSLLDKAKGEIAAGDVSAARESLTGAEAFAAKVLKAVGR